MEFKSNVCIDIVKLISSSGFNTHLRQKDKRRGGKLVIQYKPMNGSGRQLSERMA